MTTGTCYLIECRTGCTCCRGDNHYRGPFSTKEAAEEAKEAYLDMRLLASQYSDRGVYRIVPVSYELLPDGRMIIDEERIWTSGFQDECLGLDDEYCGEDRWS